MIPEMERYGYDQKIAAGTVAAAGTFGILIPPSLVLVVFGIITETPIGPLFIAGILPGLLTIAIYIIGVVILVYIKPELTPPAKSYSWNERIKSIKGLWGIILLVSLIWGGIYGGVFTPTEAGGAGAFGAIIILLLKVPPKRSWQVILKGVPDAVSMTGMIFITMVTATLFSKFLTLTGVLDSALYVMSTSQWPRWVMVILIFSISSLMGCFVTAMGVLLLIAPVACTVLTNLGYHPIWVGIMMVKLFELANITPPVGMNVFVVKGIASHIPMETIFRGCFPFVIMDVVTITLLVIFPEITLWLPRTMG